MAFPTSGLSNNQVHKEGNRAFVYDSTLGTWDQLRESDRTENKIRQGEIGSGVNFPAGHMRHLAFAPLTTINNNATSGYNMYAANLSTGLITAGSSIWMTAACTTYYGAGNANHYGYWHFSGKAASTGTASHSGMANNDSNRRFGHEIGYTFTAAGHLHTSGHTLVTPTNGATWAEYNLWFTQSGTKQFYHYGMTFSIFEVYA